MAELSCFVTSDAQCVLDFRGRASVEVLAGGASTWFSDGADRSHFPFLFTENNLGVPEVELRQIYLFAVRTFGAALKVSRLHKLEPHPIVTPVIQDVIDSSAVLIFMNSAHRTALNVRKRLIEHKHMDVGRELEFTTVLLSCRHCCKHGELWHHRRWLLQRIHPVQNFHQGPGVDTALCSQNFYLTLNDLAVEMNLVARACELYPRNYFGWTHRTICMQSTLVSMVHSTTSDAFTETLSKEAISITQWIDSHISDYSAVHHLKTLTLLAGDVDASILPPIGHVIALVCAYPEHETLWMYLRSFWVEGDVTAEFIASFVLALQNTGMTGEGDKLLGRPNAAHHARHFLEWRHRGSK